MGENKKISESNSTKNQGKANSEIAKPVKISLRPAAIIEAGLNKALNSQHSIAASNLNRLRRLHPEKSPEELAKHLSKWYVSSVAATGAAAGAAAIVPNLVVQVPAALADFTAFLELSVLYVLSVAEVHGLDIEDSERRRLLVTSVLLGNSASTVILEKVIGRTGPHWGKLVVAAIPRDAINQANRILGPRFITIAGTRTGVLVLGKQVPLMIGSAIGGTGNALFGFFVVKSAKKILGPPPTKWPKKGTARKKAISA